MVQRFPVPGLKKMNLLLLPLEVVVNMPSFAGKVLLFLLNTDDTDDADLHGFS